MSAGYKTTEFWISIATQAIALLVLMGVIAPGDRDTIQGAVINAVTAVASLIAAVAVIVQYIRSRQILKASVASNQIEPLAAAIDPDVQRRARAAGVPWVTLIIWAIMYGPRIKELLDALIDGWRKDRTVS